MRAETIEREPRVFPVPVAALRGRQDPLWLRLLLLLLS